MRYKINPNGAKFSGIVYIVVDLNGKPCLPQPYRMYADSTLEKNW